MGIKGVVLEHYFLTPCEERGYKVGDVFKVLHTTDAFAAGSIVSLNRDDGTEGPMFKLISGDCCYELADDKTTKGAYCSLDSVELFTGSLYSIQDAYDAICLLNLSLNRLDKESTKEERLFQLALVEEELAETKAATRTNDLLEELDGACDLFVTVAGHMQQLERLGCDVKGALEKVCENNLSKLIADGDHTEIELTTAKYAELGTPIVFEKNQITGLTACKHAVTGKGLKPASYSSVNISMCLP